MKPILFEKDATDFTTLGIARLPDCISCLVTESLQGEFELEMVYPVSGRMFEEITEDRIIVVPPSDGGSKQAFRIYRITTPIDGKVEVSARHISYQLNYIISAANTINIPQNTTPEGAYLLATQFAPMQNPFSFDSEITTVKRYQVPVARSVRTILGGMENSIIDIWGGELIWDNWQIHHVQRRGSDNGVRITYGKNLTAVSRSVDIGSAVTGVVAYYLSDNVDPILRQPIVVYTNPRVIYSDDPSGFAYERVVAVDATGEFEEEPTVAQLTEWAQDYIAKTELKSIIDTVTVDFVPLWQSPEYKDYAPLERVSLGDTVYIGYRQLGISVKKRVTATVYDVLANRYESIELGGEPTLSDTIAAITDQGESNSNAVATLSKGLLDKIYPVGSIYMSTSATSPQDFLGGTWERITGRFLLAATDGGASGGNSNASIAPGGTGGEATHKLTESEMPSHTHTIPYTTYNTATSGTSRRFAAYSGSTVNTGSNGGDAAHNNMPPYLAVYVWERTA